MRRRRLLSRVRLSHRQRAAIVIALLFVTLGVVARLAWEAYAAAVAHRAMAHRALTDYAAFAGWQFVAHSRTERESRFNRSADVRDAEWRGIFRRVIAEHRLLPPDVTGAEPTDSLLSITVLRTSGQVLWRSPAAPGIGGFNAIVEPGPALDGLKLRVVLRADAAGRLLIGGMPRSRLPLLVALLALSTAVIAIAVIQLRREAELARLRADFASSVSHELRTPLAQIRMFAETLRLGRVRNEVERARSLAIIDQEARRLTHLVENVLQFSRAERHAVHIAPQPTDLAAEILDAVEAFEPLARSRRVRIRTVLEEDIVAPVDRNAPRQMLLNLFDNAVKYGPPGQTIYARLGFSLNRALIRVDDEGPGIPERERDRIWEPFIRLARDANSSTAGSGIGLAVVSDIVSLHGGRAWAERAPGGGTRIVVELPSAQKRGTPEPRGRPRPSAKRSLANP